MKMKKFIYAVVAFTPILASAQQTPNLAPIKGLVSQTGGILSLLIPMAFAFAILWFFYGIAQFVSSAGDAKKAAEGKSIMIYGVIAIAVMASLFGIVHWLQGVSGATDNTTIQAPTITIPQ